MNILIVIAGIFAIFVFAGVIRTFAAGSKAQVQVLAEGVIAGAIEKRTDQFEDFKTRMEGKTIYSHDEIMTHFKVK